MYGSTLEHAERLRDPVRRGFLLEGIPAHGGKTFLPFDTFSLIECNTGMYLPFIDTSPQRLPTLKYDADTYSNKQVFL